MAQSVFVLVMGVRIMRMGMVERVMVMPMAVGFAGRIIRMMDMLVMLVMNVHVFVIHGLVPMSVFVPFREVEPDAKRHQHSSNPEREAQRFPQDRQ